MCCTRRILWWQLLLRFVTAGLSCLRPQMLFSSLASLLWLRVVCSGAAPHVLIITIRVCIHKASATSLMLFRVLLGMLVCGCCVNSTLLLPFNNSCAPMCRKNLIGNIFRQYQQTGYIWEQYDDLSGMGKVSTALTCPYLNHHQLCFFSSLKKISFVFVNHPSYVNSCLALSLTAMFGWIKSLTWSHFCLLPLQSMLRGHVHSPVGPPWSFSSWGKFIRQSSDMILDLSRLRTRRLCVHVPCDVFCVSSMPSALYVHNVLCLWLFNCVCCKYQANLSCPVLCCSQWLQ